MGFSVGFDMLSLVAVANRFKNGCFFGGEGLEVMWPGGYTGIRQTWVLLRAQQYSVPNKVEILSLAKPKFSHL